MARFAPLRRLRCSAAALGGTCGPARREWFVPLPSATRESVLRNEGTSTMSHDDDRFGGRDDDRSAARRGDAPGARRNARPGEGRGPGEPGITPCDEAREESRRWGYDVREDVSARGVARDERQFGGDRGRGDYGGDRRGLADDPLAPHGAPPRQGGDASHHHDMPPHVRPVTDDAAPDGRPGSAWRACEGRSDHGRQGEFQASDAARPGLGGESVYGPGDWGGRDGSAHRRDGDNASPARHAGGDRGARYVERRDPGIREPSDAGRRAAQGGRPGERWGAAGDHDGGRGAPARASRERGVSEGDGGYGGTTGVGGIGDRGMMGADAGRGGRAAIPWSGGIGGDGDAGEDDRAGLGDRAGFGGAFRGGDPGRGGRLDAEVEPGRNQHLAAGSGGSGDWEASAYSIGQRRGPVDADAPYRAAPDFDPAGWPGDRSPQQRFGANGPARPAPLPPSGPPRGPRGWQRTDASLHDALCERLARSHDLEVADVSVEVRDGHVTLEGTVADRPMKRAIEDRIDAFPGVRDIDNRIKLMRPGIAPAPDAPPSPHASVPQDSPTARDEARGHFSEPMRGGSGKNG
jgi:hypothetical protein